MKYTNNKNNDIVNSNNFAWGFMRHAYELASAKIYFSNNGR